MKTILITGASTGIGKACSLAAAQADFIVYAGYRKEIDKEVLQKLHRNIQPIKLDVAVESQRKAAFDYIQKQHGWLDCLFNNAGVAASGTAEFQSIDKFRNQMEINFFSPVVVTQLFIPLLRKSKTPRIIFTSSAAGILAKPMMASYSASKFALEAFADTIRLELAPWNFKVSILEPGKIKTEIYKKSLEEAQMERAQMSPLEVSLYKPLLDAAMYNIENADSMSSDVSEVVDVFLDALIEESPKTRYPVGGDAKMQALMAKFFPDKLKDWIIAQKLKKFAQKRVSKV